MKTSDIIPSARPSARAMPADAPRGGDPGPDAVPCARAVSLTLTGLAVGPGVCVGVVHLHGTGALCVPEYRIPASRIESEQRRLALAARQGVRQLAALRDKARLLPEAAGAEFDALLDAYQKMLEDSRLIKGVSQRIARDSLNAEAAVKREVDALAEAFAAMDDAYLAARVDDIRDIGRRLIQVLTRETQPALTNLPRNAVIVAQDLSPADTALIDPRRVAGLVLATGGAESHTAIMARSLGLPAVVAVPDLLRHVQAGDTLCLDGRSGTLVLNPDRDTLALFRKRRADVLRQRRTLARLRDLPAETRDGVRISLSANVELSGELDAVRQAGAEGIGLLRSEFLFMNRSRLPDEEEQYQFFRAIVAGMEGRPVTIRTLDVGGEKLSDALALPDSPNPALGLRAIRLSLARPELLETQLAAIVRAGVHGPVRLLLPMVGTRSDLDRVRVILDAVVDRLRRENRPLPDPLPPLGVMIEIPGAALSADALALRSDFFAIGTNDLIQYTLAIDRADQAVAHLYDPLHPAVLRLIQFTVEAAHRARIPVSVCGEMAGDPRLAAVLLGLGVRDLSMTAASIPLVKRTIRRLAIADLDQRIRAIMSQSDTARIAAMANALIAEG